MADFSSQSSHGLRSLRVFRGMAEWSRLQSQSYSAQLERSGATQIATVWVGRKRSFGLSTVYPKQSKNPSAVR